MTRLSISHLQKVVRFLQDPRTNRKYKLLALAALFYIIWPFDIMPDFVPFAGWIDDVGLAALAFWYLSRIADHYHE